MFVPVKEVDATESPKTCKVLILPNLPQDYEKNLTSFTILDMPKSDKNAIPCESMSTLGY